MITFNGALDGREQMILLPIEQATFPLHTDGSGNQVFLNSGQHCIVAGGKINVQGGDTVETDQHDAIFITPRGFLLDDADDDNVVLHKLKFRVGPVWRSVVQVSVAVAPVGILSEDADDVDHSRWVIRKNTWKLQSEPEGKRIEVTADLETQGNRNGWVSVSYKVFATGTLAKMPRPEDVSHIEPGS